MAEGDRLLRIGGAMDKIGEPALNNSGVIVFRAESLTARRASVCSFGTRDRGLFVGDGDRAQTGNGPIDLPTEWRSTRRRDRLASAAGAAWG